MFSKVFDRLTTTRDGGIEASFAVDGHGLEKVQLLCADIPRSYAQPGRRRVYVALNVNNDVQAITAPYIELVVGASLASRERAPTLSPC
jgi:hypothetical protein